MIAYVPVAQLDRASDSDSEGRWFESSRAYQSKTPENLAKSRISGVFLFSSTEAAKGTIRPF